MVNQRGVQTNGWGIVGFLISLLAIISLMFSIYAGLGLGILGLIFCIIQFKKRKTGLAIAGLILSIIAIVWSIIVILLTIFVWTSVENTIQSGVDKINQQTINIRK